MVAAAALASVAGLAGCGSEARRDSPAVATPGHPLTSPSGRYELAVATGRYGGAAGSGEYWRIQIRDHSGHVELDSRKLFSVRFGTSVVWDDRRDRAWVHSSDVGTSWWDRVATGRWRRGELDPRGLATGVPPVPRSLVELYPSLYGPEGRAAARRSATDPTDVSPKCGAADDDIRLECPMPP